MLKSFLYPLLLIFVVTACGKKEKITTTCADPLFNPTFSTVRVQTMLNNTKSLVNHLNQQKFGLFTMLIAEPNYTPVNPLVLSEEKVDLAREQLATSLRERFPGPISAWILEGKKGVIETEGVDRVALQEAVSQINLLASKSTRWNNYQCSLNALAKNASKDVSVFYQLDQQDCQSKSDDPQCLEYQLDRWTRSGDHIRVAERYRIRHSIIKMCSHFKSLTECQQDFLKHIKSGQLTAYYLGLKEHYRQKKYNRFFTLLKPKKFACRKNGEGVIEMTIPYTKRGNEDAYFSGGLKYGLLYIEGMWRNRKLQLKFKQVGKGVPNAVQINFQTGITSSVRSDQPYVMNINAGLKGMNLLKTIAHEFGHIVGFPDCYIEYYTHSKAEITYYELEAETQNLMCSNQNGWRIPDHYFDQLIKKSCSF